MSEHAEISGAPRPHRLRALRRRNACASYGKGAKKAFVV